jgi:transglutaminase-like putative cysteine protease
MNDCSPNLETAIATIHMLDHRQVEWPRARRTQYLIHQHLRYEYPGPIADLDQRLMILPPKQHGNQRRLDYRLAISAPDFRLSQQSDEFGNQEIKLHVPEIAQAIDFEVWILVERHATPSTCYLPARWLKDARLLEPSPLTQADGALRQVAAAIQESSKDWLELAQHINEWTSQALRYEHNITTIHTTAAEALALGRGVCQDYAHIMLALCRLCGLPARYVSGHMVGEGGTHAWVEVILPVAEESEMAQVVPFDPTHSRQAGMNYLTIAVGRDYYDVAPTSGTYRAAYSGQLIARKRVDLTLLEYPESAIEA